MLTFMRLGAYNALMYARLCRYALDGRCFDCTTALWVLTWDSFRDAWLRKATSTPPHPSWSAIRSPTYEKIKLSMDSEDPA